MYNRGNIVNVFFPGNDIKNLPIYELYSKIKSHFRFPCKKDVKKSCPKCYQAIGAWVKNNVVVPVKRSNYYRIFKDEIEMQKEMKKKKQKLLIQ